MPLRLRRRSAWAHLLCLLPALLLLHLKSLLVSGQGRVSQLLVLEQGQVSPPRVLGQGQLLQWPAKGQG
jgi:hypothetical protein